MEKRTYSLQTELWHPYRKPEGTHVNQGAASVEAYLTDSQDHSRLGRVTDGL